MIEAQEQSAFSYSCKHVSLAAVPTAVGLLYDATAYMFEIEKELRCLDTEWKRYLRSRSGKNVIDLKPYFQVRWRLDELMHEAAARS